MKPVATKTDSGMHPYVSKDYYDMIRRVTVRGIFDQKEERRSIREKPYLGDNYHEMKHYYPIPVASGTNPTLYKPDYPGDVPIVSDSIPVIVEFGDVELGTRTTGTGDVDVDSESIAWVWKVRSSDRTITIASIDKTQQNWRKVNIILNVPTSTIRDTATITAEVRAGISGSLQTGETEIVIISGGLLYSFYGVSEGNATLYCREYAASSDTWTAKANGPTPVRSTVAVGTIGSFCYCCGGHTGGELTRLADCDRYSQSANSWTSMTNMIQAVRYPAGAADGNLMYVFGGNDSGGYTTTCDVYDKGGDSWANKNSMNVGRGYLSASKAGGKLYSSCGTSGGGEAYMDDHEEYNIGSNTWTAKSDYTGANRYGLGAFGLQDKVYACCGTTGAASNTCHEYSPGGDSWAAKTSAPTARYYLGSSTYRNKGYAVAGNQAGSDTNFANERYTASTNSWESMGPTIEDLSSNGTSVI